MGGGRGEGRGQKHIVKDPGRAMVHLVKEKIVCFMFGTKYKPVFNVAGETEEKKTSDINSYFKETFDTSHSVPTLFLDNYPDLNDNRQERKLRNIKEVLHSLTITTSHYSFYN